jgi:cytochrome c oxidase subunit 4
MQQTVTEVPTASLPATGHDDAGPHPGQAQYIRVAAILALVTAVEVGLYYTDLSGLKLVSLLAGLAAVKFAMVAAYFMHLRFDGRLLRQMFVTGIVLACGVYFVALVTLDVLVG